MMLIIVCILIGDIGSGHASGLIKKDGAINYVMDQDLVGIWSGNYTKLILVMLIDLREQILRIQLNIMAPHNKIDIESQQI